MRLEIISPEKIIYQGDIDELIVQTADGEITILPHHVNLFTKIQPGELTINIAGKEQFLAITGGFLEITENNVSILADYAVRAEEIEVEKAIEAQKRAETILKKKEEGISEQDFAIAQGELQKALLELKVAKRHHHHTQLVN
jgi:F-type H+-transporting ATPase subunit epsilon